MIDRKLLLTDFDNSVFRLGRKGVKRELLEELKEQLERERALRLDVDTGRANANKAAAAIGQMTAGGTKQDIPASMLDDLQVKKGALASLEEQLSDLQASINNQMLRIPNFPDDKAPEGADEKANVVMRYHGYNASEWKSGAYKPHWEVASKLGIYDAERAAKISGSMFSLLRGDGARLLRALVKFGLDLNSKNYEEIAPPHLVSTATFTATGHLPKFEVDAYRLRDDEAWLIPTGEVPLMSIHRDEVIPASELPKRFMAYTVCFRREAGSAGKDTRGLQRLHEFHKVELLKLCLPEQVQAEFDTMLTDAEKALQLLHLPYRVVDLCAGDLTFSSARIFDLEVYAPGVDRWLEVSSVGMFTDFQARRGNIRFRRNKSGKTEFVHALNGAALATPRVWASIIEHGQQPDGSVKIPEVLVPFMGKEFIGPPQ